MLDQATELRRLVAGANLAKARPETGPRTISISGGNSDFGATTIALNLAAVLAAEALRVVLIDADLACPEIASACGLAGGLGLSDVLEGRKSIHEALRRGSGGIQILSGHALGQSPVATTAQSLDRLLRQMQSLAPHADFLIVDTGNQPTDLARRMWASAERVILVTSPDPAAVMDTYALIKRTLSPAFTAVQIELIVTQADAPTALDVQQRIDQSCRRFLGLSVQLACNIPRVARSVQHKGTLSPASLAPPQGKLGQAVSKLAHRLVVPPHALNSRDHFAA